jgi:hypothetical protein
MLPKVKKTLQASAYARGCELPYRKGKPPVIAADQSMSRATNPGPWDASRRQQHFHPLGPSLVRPPANGRAGLVACGYPFAPIPLLKKES